MRLKQFLLMTVAAIALILSVFVGPVHAQTGYGDDTVPPRSLTADGGSGGGAVSGKNASNKGSNTAGIVIGVILGIVVIGGVLFFVLGKKGDGAATT